MSTEESNPELESRNGKAYESRKTASERVDSIDALRGFDMFWIIGGTEFLLAFFQKLFPPLAEILAVQFDHSSWSGFTFLDLIFPLFIFIMGATIPFSIAKSLDRGDTRRILFVHIVKRTIALFILGWLYGNLGKLNPEDFRYLGVLQRIALCYFSAAVIVMSTRPKHQTIAAAAVLLFYWAIMMLVPVPGIGPGVLTPEGNLAFYVDRQILPGKLGYFGYGDSEGILSTLPAVGTALLGVSSGNWLRAPQPRSATRRALGLLWVGLASLLVALIWNLVFPINKLLWTSSYVLYAGGWSLLLLGVFYWIIDARKQGKWSFPFRVIGLNSILVYLTTSWFDFDFMAAYTAFLGDISLLFWTTIRLVVEWLFLYVLYRQGVFLKA